MKIVSFITRLDIKNSFLEKKHFQFKHFLNFLREVIFPFTSQIVKDSQIFRLNKFC